jgi:hypothetical protein
MGAAYDKNLLYARESKAFQCPIQQRGIADGKKTLANPFRECTDNARRA